MGGIYRQVDSNGQVSFSDTPSSALSNAEALKQDGRRASPSATHEEVKQYIKDTQKYVPKLRDYFEYIEFLRSHSPARHRMMLEALKREDPQTYLKLMKYPQFRPLYETALGLKAADKNLAAGIGAGTGQFTGSVEKWLETSVQNMMKQQRWGGYADVLGDKATTLPTKTPSYSNSRLGQYLKGEDARAAAASKAARTGLESSRAAIRGGIATSVSRVGGTALGVAVEMLDAEKAVSIGQAELANKARHLYEKGVIDEIEWSECQSLLSSGRYVEMQKLMNDAVQRYVFGKGR